MFMIRWRGKSTTSWPERTPQQGPGRLLEVRLQVTDAKPYRHRFPLSYRDVQELLYQRVLQVSHETLRKWCIKFATLFTEELRHWLFLGRTDARLGQSSAG